MTTVTNQIECDAILFDLDGVLIDSTSCIVRHWKHWADQHGLDIHEIMRHAHGIRAIETMRMVAPQLDVEKEAMLFNAYELEDTVGVVAIEGAYQVLAVLPVDAWALVTSASLNLVKARFTQTALPFPQTIVTAEDVRQGKPAPEPYLVGAQRLGVAAERCVVIEDAPAGVEAGKKAGMRVIGIAATHQREVLLEREADFVIDRLTNLKVREARNGYHLVIQLE